ncbi:MAG: hypothetical protein A2722_01325 [Candidatus Doudnabacteria bacterium RIFCSPHIGHO2_01_FULL_50_11]|uniref:Uncharacterized protein n=1 Tax=Candidatus Doudnabacteria bacterium RIFCSPHIGHO2_01_FULL_50_11 TaxID=1817828 RepID=A0A1F5PHA3_9BACT|nr:MAG: hypothetical protein A2722_01325 [Candidatus Doudnabacteria bacterium RIFCSPHIGHO2_01_FULL_50_11]
MEKPNAKFFARYTGWQLRIFHLETGQMYQGLLNRFENKPQPDCGERGVTLWCNWMMQSADGENWMTAKNSKGQLLVFWSGSLEEAAPVFHDDNSITIPLVAAEQILSLIPRGHRAFLTSNSF